MASTFAVTRNHLIFGLCLPLAVLLGYMLADIDDPASRLVIVVSLGVLAIPMLMRWYHPLLIISWNMAAYPALPGNPQLWVLMSMLALLVAVLNRSVNVEHQFAYVPTLTRPLIAFAVVLLLTAFITGGIGFNVLGSSAVGGKRYLYIMAAIAGFYAMISRPIPPNRAMLYVGLFFLPGLTALSSRVANWIGPQAYLIYYLFPPDFVPEGMDVAVASGFGMVRVGGMTLASLALFCWVLARYGITGVFDFTRPWRAGLLILAVFACVYGGFRSSLVLQGLIFIILFFVEKLWRTRIAVILLLGGVLGGALLAGFATRLPLVMQRTLSFLPIKIDNVTRESAAVSTQWRIDMWKTVLPQVPRYLLKGKGYNIAADDLFMAQVSSVRGTGASWEEAAVAGDYHNGPLSVVIPFGIYGMVVFLWLTVAGTRFLYTMFRDGAPELRRINAFLFALFLARILFFFFVFGTLYSEFYYFTGILGLSVALNVAGQQRAAEAAPAPAG